MRSFTILIPFLLLACKHDAAAPPPATNTAAPTPTPTATAPATQAAPTPAPVASLLPAKIGKDKGIVFADKQGGTVESLADGTEVDVVSVHEAEMGVAAASTVEVKVSGKHIKLPIDRVLREDALTRAADGKLAVFHTISACGDACHTALFVIAADGRRVKLGDGAVDVATAWRPDGQQVAIGSGELWIVDLPSLAVQHLDKYTAPAYAPDGKLYVRDQDGSGFAMAADNTAKRVHKAKHSHGGDGDEGGGGDPAPATFDATGKISWPS
jgi:hypothetical protein